jgi:hypothetical protein
MANLKTEELTTINVKFVRKSAWEAAKRAKAHDDGENMGAWLSDAIEQRINREANQIESPADQAANPGRKPGNPPMTPDQMIALMTSLAEMEQSAAAAKAVKLRTPPHLRATRELVQQLLVERGVLPARPQRTISGKSLGKATAKNGQSLPLNGQSIVLPAAE